MTLMLELSRFVPVRPRNLRDPFAAVKLNKGFTDGCHNNFDIIGLDNNSEGLADHRLIRASARDPPRRTD
jgi:hypothetical protein